MNRGIAGVRNWGTVAVLLAACASTPEPTPTIAVEVTPPPVQTPPQPAEPQAASTTPPQLGDPKPLTLPQVIERRLNNGLRLLIVQHHELPIADFQLVVKSGSEEDPARREGLAYLTSAMLDEGTRT